MSLTLELVVLALATFRVTRLVTRDDFPPIHWARTRIQGARSSVMVRAADGSDSHWRYWWLGELVTCPWCASAYVSGALVAFVWFVRGMPLPVLCWLAVWGAGATLVFWTDD